MIKEIFNTGYEPHISSGKFSISSISQCRRKKYLEMKGLYKEKYDAKTLRTFEIGDMFHRQAVKELMEKSEQHGLHVVATECDIPEHPFLSGRADVIIAEAKTGERFVVDIKSCTDYTLDKAMDGEVSDSYIYQVQLYLHLFNLKKGYILFYGKHKGIVEEHEVIYDKALCERLIAEIEKFINYNIKENIEPPPCDEKISPWGCPVCSPKENR
jgi:predicted phage-related endonuclease